MVARLRKAGSGNQAEWRRVTQFFSTRNTQVLCAISGPALLCDLPFAAAGSAPPAPHYAANAVMCVAACKDTPPQTIDSSSLLLTDPLPPPHQYDNNLVLRDVWCGEQGSCIAFNNIAPPRLRDKDDTYDYTRNYIAVIQVHQ